jgi:hypothetical protein
MVQKEALKWMFLWDQGVYVCWEFVSFVRNMGGGLGFWPCGAVGVEYSEEYRECDVFEGEFEIC